MGVRPWCAANKDIPDWHCPSAFPAWAATYDMTPTCEVAVVGAGTGGLYAALRMLEVGKVNGSDVCIFEATDRVGGRLYSLRGLGPNKDLTVDAGGAHKRNLSAVFPFSSKVFHPLRIVPSPPGKHPPRSFSGPPNSSAARISRVPPLPPRVARLRSFFLCLICISPDFPRYLLTISDSSHQETPDEKSSHSSV